MSEQIDLPGAASTTRRTKVPNICTLRAPDGTRGVMTAHRGWLVAYFFREASRRLRRRKSAWSVLRNADLCKACCVALRLPMAEHQEVEIAAWALGQLSIGEGGWVAFADDSVPEWVHVRVRENGHGRLVICEL